MSKLPPEATMRRSSDGCQTKDFTLRVNSSTAMIPATKCRFVTMLSISVLPKNCKLDLKLFHKKHLAL